jgi:hypothetical protein
MVPISTRVVVSKVFRRFDCRVYEYHLLGFVIMSCLMHCMIFAFRFCIRQESGSVSIFLPK